ncbi:MAG: hypothetical protein M1291_01600 [Thaumarchaeota archaeon]|jgi:putative copper export protein|nr:hypothetical protein [Nitrososphaerota archaeon]
MSAELHSLSRTGILSILIQALALIAVLAYNRLLFIDYLHVLSAAMWFGSNVLMGVIFYRLVKTMPQEDQLDISRRFLPLTLYFLPSISITTIITGILLLSKVGQYVPSSIRLAIYLIASVLLILSIAGYVPNSLYLYRMFSSGKYDGAKMVSRSLSNFKISLVQTVIQLAMIGIMAYVVSVLIP